VVRRLKKAGAVLLGKLNLHEFAYGGTSAVTYFGPVHNPSDLTLTLGGSSGGPGGAFAADLCLASIGTRVASRSTPKPLPNLAIGSKLNDTTRNVDIPAILVFIIRRAC
jgi:hypothetical protein